MNVSAEPEYDYSWGYGDFPNGIRIQAGKVIHVNAEAVEWYLEGVLVSYEHDYTTTEECILEKHEGDSSPDIIKIYLALRAYLWVKVKPHMPLPCTVTTFLVPLPVYSEVEL